MLDENSRTNLFKFRQALLKVGKEPDKNDNQKEEFEEMPISSPLKISTITFCFKIGTNNFLNIIGRYIKIYDPDSPEVMSNDGQIVYSKHIYSLPRGDIERKQKPKKKRAKTKHHIGDDDNPNTRFPNQVTVTFRYCGIRNISVMIFSNGAIKMAGLLSQQEGFWVASRVKEILKNVKIDVYDSYNSLPTHGNRINDFNIVVNKGISRSFRWLTIDGYTAWHPVDTLSQSQIDKISKDADINNFWYDVDINFNKLLYINKIKDHIDLDGKINVDMLETEKITHLYGLQNPDNAVVNGLKICMINSDFNFFFYIKSDVLRDLLTNKYQIDSSYGVQGYNAVKSQYKWNPTNTTGQFPGMCQCPILCSSKTKSKNKCKIITISVFQNGNAIITGATNMKQLVEAHDFIVRIISDNYKALYKKEPYINRKKVVSGRTNCKNKKRIVIQLQKNSIANIENAQPKINININEENTKSIIV
jgi:hypothetical protein